MNIREALKVDNTQQQNKKVNIFVGRFQPFTLGHIKVAEELKKKNGLNTVMFLVKSKNKSKDDFQKRPFDLDIQSKMLDKITNEYKIISDYFVINTAAIDVIFNELRSKGYEPVLWGTGTDRLKSYSYQVDNENYRKDLNCLDEFSLYEIQRGDEDVSATKVRNAIKEDDFDTFKSIMPKSLHSMYDEFKEILQNIKESKYIKVKSFENFIKE